MNLSVLIVDDEYEKVKLIKSLMPDNINVDLVHTSTSKEALNKLKHSKYALLIIDLQIPEAIGEDINPNGGRNLLEFIDSATGINKPTHILGITSHRDSYEECYEAFSSRGWSLMCGTDDHEKIKGIIAAKLRHSINPNITYDVAILTALEKVELQALLMTPCDWIPITFKEDCNVYYSGSILSSTGKNINLIATSCQHMGMAYASANTMKMCLRFKPEYIFMTGIAAGIEGKVELGDIMIADPCWDWGNGKQTIKDGKPIFLSAPRQENMQALLRSKFQRASRERKFLDDIYNAWPTTDRPKSALNSHIGPIASGSMVLEDPSIVQMIQSQHRETIGVEMEAYGLASASSISMCPAPKSVIIKSVCDFADPHKNDQWQAYAAYTSSNFAVKFIQSELYSD